MPDFRIALISIYILNPSDPVSSSLKTIITVSFRSVLCNALPPSLLWQMNASPEQRTLVACAVMMLRPGINLCLAT
jgi:hypothetical protein